MVRLKNSTSLDRPRIAEFDRQNAGGRPTKWTVRFGPLEALVYPQILNFSHSVKSV